MCHQIIDDVADVKDLIFDNASLLDQLHLVAHHVVVEVVLCVRELVEAGLQFEVGLVHKLLL